MSAPRFTTGTSPLSPPVFRDERLSDVARLVYWIAGIILASLAVFAPVLIVVSPSLATDPVTLVVPLYFVMAAAALVFVRSGHPIGGARVLVAGLWLLNSGFSVVSGGMDSPALPALLFVIILAGILLGRRECAVAAVVVAGTVLGIAWADAAGSVAATPHWVTPWLRVGLFASYSAAVAGLQISSYRSLRRAVESARQANEGLSTAGKVYDTTSEGIVVTTPDGSIVDVNEAFLRIHGYARAEVIGHNPRMMKSGKHGPDFYRDMWEAILTTGRWQGEIWDRRADGTLLATRLSIATVKDDEGETTHYVSVFSDITAVKQGEVALEWLATHDSLTHLPNRALLEDRLTTVLARSRRQGGGAAVFFLDLDHFKDVNDTLGHPAGDRLLVEIAERCESVVRDSDTIGRSGGDEFTVVVSDFSSVEDLSLLARRLLAAIERPVALAGREAYVTASIGIAMYPEDGADAAELTRHADVAMYRAKALGRNRSAFFSRGLQDEVQHRVELEGRLRQALRDDRLFTVYQPQVDLGTGRIIGIEALARWREADGSIIMPDDFIPIAESSGLIFEVGAAVLRQVCLDMRVLADAGHRLTMAVNFSARQLTEQDVAGVVITAVKAAGLDPGCFEVEITESSIMTRAEVVAAKVRSLQDEGVCVTIDDFGTGYASMSYVMDFHPSKLKIDKRFVWGLPDDPSARAIVNATIALAQGTGAKVLAEGPETEEQVRFLREAGCDFAQGFYFSRGIPFADLLDLLDEGSFPLPR